MSLMHTILTAMCLLFIGCGSQNQSVSKPFDDDFSISLSEVQQLMLGMMPEEVLSRLNRTFPKKESATVWVYDADEGGEYYLAFFTHSEGLKKKTTLLEVSWYFANGIENRHEIISLQSNQ